jgi:hypothetical protein
MWVLVKHEIKDTPSSIYRGNGGTETRVYQHKITGEKVKYINGVKA